MENKVLFIVTNGIKDNLELFKQISDEDFLAIHLLSYKTLLTPKYTKYLQNYNFADIIIALEREFFNQIDEEISKYLLGIFDQKFSNFLMLYKKADFIEHPDVQKGQENCYLLPENGFAPSVKTNFILYLIKIYHASTLSARLLDYIKFSFSGIVQEELLKKKALEIEELNQQLSYTNKIDYLTKLYNRQTIFEFLEKEQKRTRRGEWRAKNQIIKEVSETRKSDFKHIPQGELLDHITIFTLLMIDVDHFKMVNDTYGHLVGDQVLKTLGELFSDKQIFRETDVAGRIGGEEFVIILPETNVKNALQPAKRLMETIQKIEFQSHDERGFQVTVSIGMSQYHTDDKAREDIIMRADKALYHAKKQGRNRIVVYEDEDWLQYEDE